MEDKMPRIAQVSCDGCGKSKKDENHWWVIRVVEMLHLYTYKWWEEKSFDFPDGEIMYFCGSGCASKKINEFMTNQSIFPKVEAENSN